MKLLNLIGFFLLVSGCSSESVIKAVLPVSADGVFALVESYKNDKAVLLNVWATWCVPCVEEFPHIVDMQRKYGDELQVIFISADFPEQLEQINDFLTSQKVDWQTYIKDDNDEAFIDAVHTKWSGALPVTVIYNKKGELVTWFERAATHDEFNTFVQQAIQSYNN